MDIAQLGIAVDSRPVVKSEQDLNRLAVAGERAERKVVRSAANMNRGLVSTAKGARGMEKDASGATNTLRQLSFQINQIGQQGAATGNLLGAALIQLPDILQLLGGFKFAIAGAAAGVGAALIPALFRAGDSVGRFKFGS